MHRRRLIVTVGAAAVSVVCVAAGVLGLSFSVPPLPKPAARAPGPPPALWSIQVAGERTAGRPVELCADDRLRAGFTLFTLEFGAAQCPIEQLHRHGAGQNYTCRAGGREYGVSTTVDGRLDRDFVTRTSVTDIDGARTVYRRVLRFRRLGSCPRGWPIGDATDRRGRRGPAVFWDATDITAYPAAGTAGS